MASAAHRTTASAQSAPAAARSDERVTIEYYYKAQWGRADEFIELFRRNHLPLLRKGMAMGRILEVTAAAPRYHGTEDGRWDYRVTIVYPNAAAALSPSFTEDEKRALFPDTVKYVREETRRFEILLAHWDLPTVPVTLPK
jgi:hypothetical protein